MVNYKGEILANKKGEYFPILNNTSAFSDKIKRIIIRKGKFRLKRWSMFAEIKKYKSRGFNKSTGSKNTQNKL